MRSKLRGLMTCQARPLSNGGSTAAFQMRYRYVFSLAENRAWNFSETNRQRTMRMDGGRSPFNAETQRSG